MSYNINTFKVKELKNLHIPLSSFYMHPRTDWHPELINHNDGLIELDGGGDIFIKGILKDGILICHDIVCCDEGSGTFMNLILEPALKDSTGKLVASCVWEGGESINQIISNDGVVTWKDIDI